MTLPYTARTGTVGSYDVVFRRRGTVLPMAGQAVASDTPEQTIRRRPWQAYANRPLRQVRQRQLVSQFAAFCA